MKLACLIELSTNSSALKKLDTRSAVVIMALLHVCHFVLCRASLLLLTGEALVSELYKAREDV